MEQAFAQSIDEVARQVGVDLERRIAEKDVAKRQHTFGKNRLRRHRTRSAIGVLAGQLRSLIVWLLAAAAALSFYVGDRPEGLAIIAVIAINTTIGFVTELRALRSMEALRRIARVRRLAVTRRGRPGSHRVLELRAGSSQTGRPLHPSV